MHFETLTTTSWNRSQESKTVSSLKMLVTSVDTLLYLRRLNQHHCGGTLKSGNNECPSEIPLCMVCNHTVMPLSPSIRVFCQWLVKIGTVEDALNILESLTELNGNLRNEVKKDILTAVSRIKNEFDYVRSEVESANRRITELEARATETHSLLLALLDGVGGH